MADIADRASGDIELINLAAMSYRKPEGPKATGYCLLCEEELSNGARWCSAFCRDKWQVENK
jgi:hypothetical protein